MSLRSSNSCRLSFQVSAPPITRVWKKETPPGKRPGGPYTWIGWVAHSPRQPELTPSTDVLLFAARYAFLDPLDLLPTTGALVSVDAVQLLHGQLRKRIVLVHEYAQGSRLAAHVEAAGRHRDLHGIELRASIDAVVLVRKKFT